MLRLTILLIVAMAFAWETLGQDSGQLRPGLAKAEAEGRLDEVWAEARAKEAARAAAETDPEGAYYVTESSPEPKPLPARAPMVASAELPVPAVVVEPIREVVQALEDPVFSLQSFGNESVPGEDEPRILAEPEPGAEALPEAQPDAMNGSQGQIWYVQADSVNVRSEPSTDAEILGKLGSGEALLMVASVNDEWAKIVIQGDGIEGYVATRFLSPLAP